MCRMSAGKGVARQHAQPVQAGVKVPAPRGGRSSMVASAVTERASWHHIARLRVGLTLDIAGGIRRGPGQQALPLWNTPRLSRLPLELAALFWEPVVLLVCALLPVLAVEPGCAVCVLPGQQHGGLYTAGEQLTVSYDIKGYAQDASAHIWRPCCVTASPLPVLRQIPGEPSEQTGLRTGTAVGSPLSSALCGGGPTAAPCL